MKHDVHITALEIRNQGIALSKCCGNTLDLIAKYAADFRCIINEFEEQMGRVPTGDDILWIASQHADRDIKTDCMSGT